MSSDRAMVSSSSLAYLAARFMEVKSQPPPPAPGCCQANTHAANGIRRSQGTHPKQRRRTQNLDSMQC
eukprot:3177575-Prymnesium_polylepis.1